MAQQQALQQPARTYGSAQFKYVPLLLQQANSSGQESPAPLQHGFLGIMKPAGRWSRQLIAQISLKALQLLWAMLQHPFNCILALLRLPGVAYKLARSLLSTRLGKLLTATVLFLICIDISCQQRKKRTGSNEPCHDNQVEASFMCSFLQGTFRMQFKLQFSRPEWLASLYGNSQEQQQQARQHTEANQQDDLAGGVCLRPIHCPVGSHASQQELNQTILQFLAQQQGRTQGAQHNVFHITSPCRGSHIGDLQSEDNMQASPLHSRRGIRRRSSCPHLPTGLSRAASGPCLTSMACSLSDIIPTAPQTATCGMTAWRHGNHTSSLPTLQAPHVSHTEAVLLPHQHHDAVVDHQLGCTQPTKPVVVCPESGWHVHCNDLLNSPDSGGRTALTSPLVDTTSVYLKNSPWWLQGQQGSWRLHKNSAFLPQPSPDKLQGCFEQPCLKPSALHRQARELLQHTPQANNACGMSDMQASTPLQQARLDGCVGSPSSLWQQQNSGETCRKLKSNLSAPSPALGSPAVLNTSATETALPGIGPPVRSGAAETAAAAAIYRAARSHTLGRTSTVVGSCVAQQRMMLNDDLDQHTTSQQHPTAFKDVEPSIESDTSICQPDQG